jgi:hypothetical protein
VSFPFIELVGRVGGGGVGTTGGQRSQAAALDMFQRSMEADEERGGGEEDDLGSGVIRPNAG